MLAVWCDQYAGVFLSIGGARLSVRLQRQVFNLIMEQDAAFFDRMKTGSLMTILSTNVGSIQNVPTPRVACQSD
jgi:ABC-type multidrug transport system fused ATPase/permease subunit